MKWQLHDAIIEMKCLGEELRFVGGKCKIMIPEAHLHVMHERIYGDADAANILRS